MRAAGASPRRKIAAAALACAAFLLASQAFARAQSEAPMAAAAADAERMGATMPTPASTASSRGAIAEAPSRAPDARRARAADSRSAAPSPVASPPVPGAATTPAIEQPALSAFQTVPQTTQVIPRAVPSEPPTPPTPAPSEAGSSPDNDVTSYQQDGDQVFTPQLGTLRDFVAQGNETSTIGVELTEAHRKLDSGQEAQGLLVLSVKKGSPAARAGIRPYRRTVHTVLTGATLAATMVFPPAILALPVIDYTQIGESYDLIIGIDGIRATNFIDFEDQMRQTHPGEIVYLSVIRNGRRIQITVPIPSSTQMATQ